jgi:hypothetical protein
MLAMAGLSAEHRPGVNLLCDPTRVRPGVNLLTTLSLFHVAAGLMSRDQHHTIFDRDAVPGAMELRRYAVSAAAIVAITTIDILQRIFGTGELAISGRSASDSPPAWWSWKS